MVALDSATVLERGDAAPAFELPGTDGETYTLDDFADYEALLVVFTCNHCPYAKAKFDELNELAEEYDDVAVVGISSNDAEEYPEDSFENMQELVADGTIQYDAYLYDESQDVAAAYGAVCTPDPFLFVSREASRASETGGDQPGGNDGDEFVLAYHGRLDDALDPEAEPSEREMKSHIDELLETGAVDADDKPSRGCSIKWKDGNEPAYWDDL
ncbi:thioredoxin family protein [Haloarculaceae archaeon H-GB2-1]|nr:thioredoxin family protein [Haloarculaceae archaeon H-GB1-1]MEA5386117.1 thioredoxin family protein [Haloarculaceae archaeon H-GB11]MEA5407624.1 thioredoxin family protein [Haloarculaceae archaeon H-GB2-1]